MSPTPLGQNFLAGEAWRERVYGQLNVRPADVWIEIGAGQGEMLELLASRASRVVAIELDAQLAAGLRKKAAALPNVEIVEADVLTIDLAKLAATPKFRIYGSIPYYITSPILHRIYAASGNLESAHVIMQLEVAERLVAEPGHREYGYLSVATQFHSRPEILLRIPPGAFRPPPKVDSALVVLRFPTPGAKLNVGDTEAFLTFVQACFAHKRKTLANNLRGMFLAGKSTRGKVTKKPVGNPVPELLQGAGINERARAEELTLTNFAALYRAINPSSDTTLSK